MVSSPSPPPAEPATRQSPPVEPATTQSAPAVTAPPQAPGHIEADDEHVLDDNDSSLGDDNTSSTASISSSILKYREENGRTYHAYKDGVYVLPNDSAEQERLDLQHHLFLLTFEDRLYLSPAGSGDHKLRNVLDVGTGTGLWALDFADEHPESQVVGVDLSPIQTDFVPPNLSFQIDDLEEPWTFTVNFDFIYTRMMAWSFADWPNFLRQCYDQLTPGGWLELADTGPLQCDDGTLKESQPLHKWNQQLLEGTKMINRPFDTTFRYKEMLEAAGFKNVTQIVYKWPINRWPKDPKLKELGEFDPPIASE